jgi:hypothetical protein
MLRNVFGDIGHLGYGPFPMGQAASDSTIRLPAYDTVAAAALLDSAGWHPRAGWNALEERAALSLFDPGHLDERAPHEVRGAAAGSVQAPRRSALISNDGWTQGVLRAASFLRAITPASSTRCSMPSNRIRA